MRKQDTKTGKTAMYKRNTPPRQENLSNKRGFTLAEVLITLVIIGVVAAFTVPSVIANSRRAEASTKIKKFYSTLNQACMRSKALGDDWEDWAEENIAGFDYSGKIPEEFAKKYLLPHINYTKTLLLDMNYNIVLADGSMFSIFKGDCLNFTYDINGMYNNPNTDGRDRFTFLYCPYGLDAYWSSSYYGVRPVLGKNETREKALEKCKNEAWTCSGLLAIDSWEFKDDYPYRL